MDKKTGLLGNISNAFGGRQGLLSAGLPMMFGGPQMQQQALMYGLQNGAQLQAENRKTQQAQAQRNITLEYLQQNNPELAALMEAGMSGSEALRLANDERLKAQQPANPATFSKSPVYGTDPETGKTILGVVGDDGSFKRLDTGDFDVSNGLDKIDTGTEIITRDKRTGQILSVTPKQNEQAAFEKGRGDAMGKAQGASAANFGYETNALDETMSLVDSVLTHPSLDTAVGPIQGRLPSISAGARDFDERVEQIKNKAFLSARQELKGGGAITDFEGTKAESALLRASQAKSEADFIQAMNEFKQALARGKQLLAMQAGQGGPAPQQQTFGAAPQSDGDGWTSMPNGVRIRQVK